MIGRCARRALCEFASIWLLEGRHWSAVRPVAHKQIVARGRRHWSGDQCHPNRELAGVEACSRSRATRDRRHWSGDQCHPRMLIVSQKKTLVGYDSGTQSDQDTGRGASGTHCSRSRATRDRRHWSGDQCHPRMLIVSQKKTLVGYDSGTQSDQDTGRGASGTHCLRSRATRDRRHWSGDQCHPNKESLGSRPARGRAVGSRSKTLIRGPVPPKQRPSKQRVARGRGLLAIEDTGQGTGATQKTAPRGRRLWLGTGRMRWDQDKVAELGGGQARLSISSILAGFAGMVEWAPGWRGVGRPSK